MVIKSALSTEAFNFFSSSSSILVRAHVRQADAAFSLQAGYAKFNCQRYKLSPLGTDGYLT